MASNRTDLDRPASTATYVVLTLILVILSLAGIYLLYQLKKPVSPPIVENIVPTITPEPTIEAIITPSTIATKSAKPTVTPKPTLSPDATIAPTPAYLIYQSPTDGFEVSYSSARKVYLDTEFSGNRYTFYLSSGNISVHVGTQWSWTYPNRDFSSNLIVGGLPTFVYGINDQRIVDFETNGIKYTIQCVHNANQTLIEECDQFLKDFKLL